MDKGKSIALLATVVLTGLSVTFVGCHENRKAPPIPSGSLAPGQMAQARPAAREFFESLADGHWSVAARYWPADAPQGRKFNDVFTDRAKRIVRGLQIIRLGTPYRKGDSSRVYVPYEVRFKNGTTQTNNLALSRDNPDQQWCFEGGF